MVLDIFTTRQKVIGAPLKETLTSHELEPGGENDAARGLQFDDAKVFVEVFIE